MPRAVPIVEAIALLGSLRSLFKAKERKMVINLIDELRKSIDKLDREILNILSKRKGLVKEVGKLKKA